MPDGTLGAVSEHPGLDSFPARSRDKLRYGDTDRQGHVNNAVFSTLLETGRVELLFPGDGTSMSDPGASWVIVRIELDLVGEITWPGSVDIGTRVERVGSSSVTMAQGLFQAGRPVARAHDRDRADGRADAGVAAAERGAGRAVPVAAGVTSG